MSGEERDSIFGVVLWPALKTYVCVSLLGVTVFFIYSTITDDYRSEGLDITELVSIIFGYGIFSLVLGFFVALPPILLLGASMYRLAKKCPKFDTAVAFAVVGLVAGSGLMVILDFAVSIRTSLSGSALLGGLCGFVGALAFRHFVAKT
jgi:hypothetical protein